MERTKKDVLIGILAAIGFGLIGCVAWGVLYYMGIIAGLAAFLIMYLAGYAYKRFGKVKFFSTVDYVILVAISIVELVITMLVTFGLIVQITYADLGESIGFFSAITEMFELAQLDEELMMGLISDIVTSFIFIVVAVVYYIIGERRKKQAYDQLVTLAEASSQTNEQPANEVQVEQTETPVQENNDKKE